MDKRSLSSSLVMTLGAHLKVVAGSSQTLLPTLPFPWEQVVGGVKVIISREKETRGQEFRLSLHLACISST